MVKSNYMKLTKLQLENFRNHSQYSYEFDIDKDLTILVGPNGMGKTNFLEAIYVLALGKSFRISAQEEMIKWENDYLRCSSEIFSGNEKIDLEVFYSHRPRSQKSFKKNGVKMKNSEYLGNLLAVLFHPEDLNMLYLQPALRRRYMDIVLCQTDKKYLLALTKYRKILKQRNALLHEIRATRLKKGDQKSLLEDLEVWDEEIATSGSVIIEKRLKLVEFLNERLEKIYNEIASADEKISLEYESRIVKKLSKEDIKTMYGDELFNRSERDILRAETTAGPHRDDLVFFLNGKEISAVASRGEIRTLLLAVKLAEIQYIEEKTGEKPILLLDDVFSELDRKRQGHLLKSIRGCQSIITTTDIDHIGKEAKESARIELVE